jgi:hypothetical protein
MKLLDADQSLDFLETCNLDFQETEFANMQCVDAVQEKYLYYPGDYSLSLIASHTAFFAGVSYDNKIVHNLFWRLAGETTIDNTDYVAFVADPDYLVGDLEQFAEAEIALNKAAICIYMLGCLFLDNEKFPIEKLTSLRNLRWCKIKTDPETGEKIIELPNETSEIYRKMATRKKGL